MLNGSFGYWYQRQQPIVLITSRGGPAADSVGASAVQTIKDLPWLFRYKPDQVRIGVIR
jgi:hypothetical protein